MRRTNPKLFVSLGLTAMLLSGCSVVPQSRYTATDYAPIRTGEAPISRAPAAAAPRVAPAALPAARRGAEAQCLSDLGSSGVRFDPLPDQYLGDGCSTLNAVQMHALSSDTGRLNVSNLGPVTCPVSNAFAAWARFGVDRAAQQVFGSRLASIQTMGSYACRNVAGTSRRSAHATADAIDISGFVLENGRVITLKDGWDGAADEREFLRIVQRSACRRFGTVLGPDYNAAHEDHFHVEGVIEGSSYCR